MQICNFTTYKRHEFTAYKNTNTPHANDVNLQYGEIQIHQLQKMHIHSIQIYKYTTFKRWEFTEEIQIHLMQKMRIHSIQIYKYTTHIRCEFK